MKTSNSEPKNLPCESLNYTPRCQKRPKLRSWANRFLRSGTSVGAHYRESQYAKSDADLISKIEGALQELEETEYWLELIEEMGFFKAVQLQPIRTETGELKAIFITIVKKVKARKA